MKYKWYHIFILSLSFIVVMLFGMDWQEAKTLADSGLGSDVLNERLVQQLKSDQGPIKKSAEDEIVKAVLKMTYHSEWYELQPLTTQFLFADLLPVGDEELIVGISLPPDRGMVAIFARMKEGYRLIRTLYFVNVSGLEVVKIPTLDVPVLVVKEDYQERLGAFFESRTEYLYAWNDKKKRIDDVFMVVTFEQSYWNEKWENPDNPSRWRGEITKREYTIEPDGSIVVNEETTEVVSKKQTLALPPLEGFEIVKRRMREDVYVWNPRDFRYEKVTE